ncbi:response regulator [Desulfocurvus vexinensis]|uniref:response regulator n=1 Tax=Desulfocurvus vexinensis TaxID=399548 RepID=UPI000A065B01|nr:response regulator [Desulfocurvus vexinensis]
MSTPQSPFPGPWRTGALVVAAVALATAVQWFFLRMLTGNGVQAGVVALAGLALVAAPLGLALWMGLRQRRVLQEEMERGAMTRRLLRQSLARLGAVFEGSEMVAMILADGSGPRPRIAEYNPGAEKMFAASREQMLGRPLEELFAGDGVRTLARAQDELGRGRGQVAGEYELARQGGGVFPALVELCAVRGQGGLDGLLLTAVDITKRRHSEAVTYLLYRISDAVSATRDLHHLYETIHGIFMETLRARNFFIALLDEKNDRLVFPYFRDEVDGSFFEIRNLSDPGTSSLTLEVIRTGKPLMMTRAEMIERRQRTGLTPVGTLSRVWLGVPLVVRDKVIGAMAVQDYTDPAYFSRDDIGILEAVSRQVALAIERKMSEEALHEAGRAAEAASRSKSEFLANMSHEIRTPLNGILGMADLTLDSELTTEQRANLEMLRDSGRALLRVLNDILDISKIEAGKLELTEERFALRQFVRSVAEIFTVEVRRKGVDLRWTVADEVPDLLLGDGGRLRQVLVNLVGNAVKFTDQGEVTVAVTREALLAGPGADAPGAPVVLRFSVRDTGCGIPADKQGEIFESFSQVDGSLRRRYQGTGLGLAISRRLAGMMGGGITVQSEPGRGSCFEFTAVCRVAAGQAQAACPQGPCTPGPLRILVAEDNMVNMIYARRILERMGHEVVTANSGRAVLEVMARERFDCVLMDIQMPDMDGLEATRRIREAAPGPTPRTVPIVAMTAHAMRGDRERFLAAGMDAYLAKPIEPEQLVRTLADVLAAGPLGT